MLAEQSQYIKQLGTWHLSTLRVVSQLMTALAQTTVREYYTRAANEDCVNGGPWTRTKYTYDPNHPYAVDTVTSGGSTIYSASYDADGDMTTRNGYPITWTVDNLPESMASAAGSSTFNYGPDGNRYSQAATFNGVTTDTTYIGGLFEVIFTSPGTTEYRHNIVADGEIVAVHTIDQNGNAYTDYLHYDQLGSVDAITDDQGTVIQSMSFDAFGQRRDPNNWDYDLSQNTIATLKNYTDRGYTDQEQLDNLSLVDLNGRVYDPTVGRFISADPIEGFNRYAYVDNSPLDYTDPSGFVCHNGNKTLTCQEMDGGSAGYQSIGGGTAGSFGGGVTGVSQSVNPCYITGQKTQYCYGWSCWVNCSLDSINTTSMPGAGQSPASNNEDIDPGKNPNNKPNNNSKQPSQQKQQTKPCPAPAPKFEFTSHIGVYGKVGIDVGPVTLNVDINFASYNTLLNGNSYWSHGVGLAVQFGSVAIGGSWQQVSYDGGLNFQNSPTNFILGTLHASSNGANFEINPPQAFAGFTTGVDFPSSSASNGCN